MRGIGRWRGRSRKNGASKDEAAGRQEVRKVKEGWGQEVRGGRDVGFGLFEGGEEGQERRRKRWHVSKRFGRSRKDRVRKKEATGWQGPDYLKVEGKVKERRGVQGGMNG